MTKLIPAILGLCLLLNACGEKKSTTDSPDDTDTNMVAIDTGSVISVPDDTTAVVDDPATEDGNHPDPAVQKIGYINSMEVVLMMPEIKTADSKLQAYAKQLDNAIQSEMEDYQQKMVELQKLADDGTTAQAVLENRYKELAQKETTIMELRSTSEQNLLKKKEELYAPIVDKVDRAIKAVARKNQYSHVIDASTGALVFAIESSDITPLVKGYLGLR